MASGGKKADSLVWTDDEVELLLRVTLDYKVEKYQQNVDWESYSSKYGDITLAFRQHYPSGDMAAGKDFSHDTNSITKVQVTAKLKGVRNKYRHAVDSGRRSGHGCVVLIFFELCQDIWGGSPATTTIPSGIESSDMMEDSSSASRPTSPDADLESTQSSDSQPPGVVCHRRNLLQVGLTMVSILR